MVSAAEVAEQVAKAEPSQNERDQAMRMLHRWSETDASIKADDETVKLYVVLRHAHPGGRVTAKMLKGFCAKTVSSGAHIRHMVSRRPPLY